MFMGALSENQKLKNGYEIIELEFNYGKKNVKGGMCAHRQIDLSNQIKKIIQKIDKILNFKIKMGRGAWAPAGKRFLRIKIKKNMEKCILKINIKVCSLQYHYS